MSNYDDILRKKEQESSLDASLAEQHWEAVEKQLNAPSVPSVVKSGFGKMAKIIKLAVIVSGVSVISYFIYQKLAEKKREFNGVLKPSNIPSQFFTIDNTKDEVIRTSHASILKIKKGTFKTDKPVTIEVKEVFTPAEILQSGLTTTSDGSPLRSSGMLYFNASISGENIEPSVPIDAFIQTKEKDPDMQLFKGEIQSDSTVNWVAPEPITDTSRPKNLEHMIEYGRTLFMTKCASCHNIFKDLTGPALKDLQYRGPWKNPENIRRFVNNPPAFMVTDKYTQGLKAKYGSLMTGFPDLSQTDIRDLLAYLTYADKEEKIPAIAATDSLQKPDTANNCGFDTSYYSVQNYFEEYDTTGLFTEPAITDTSGYIADFDIVEYQKAYRQGYEFQITSNGWYNIDAFLKEDNNEIKDVVLSAEIVNGESRPYNVYVFVPSERVLQTYTTKKGNTYQFNFENNRLPLPLRYRAVILAFGSIGQKMQYGTAEFVIQQEQHIKIELKETTKEGLLNVLYTKNINGMQIDAIEKKMEIIPIDCPEKRPTKDTAAVATKPVAIINENK